MHNSTTDVSLEEGRKVRFKILCVSYRENQVNQDFQGPLDLKDLQERQVYQEGQEGQVLKVILVCQDFKVTNTRTLLLNADCRVHLEGLKHPPGRTSLKRTPFIPSQVPLVSPVRKV